MDTINGKRMSHAFEHAGNGIGTPIVFLHGFPDTHACWRQILSNPDWSRPKFAPAMYGCSTLAKRTNHSDGGSVGARALDCLDFLDVMAFDQVILVGADMGAQTAQAVAALYPERVESCVILNGHGIYNQAVAMDGRLPSMRTFHAAWYIWLFQSEMGEAILSENHRERFIRYVWSKWSPNWHFRDTDIDEVLSALSPNWAKVMLNAYRNDPGADEEAAELDKKLTQFPPISVPVLNLQGRNDGIDLIADSELGQVEYYKGPFERIILDGCGHFLHREQPAEVGRLIETFITQQV